MDKTSRKRRIRIGQLALGDRFIPPRGLRWWKGRLARVLSQEEVEAWFDLQAKTAQAIGQEPPTRPSPTWIPIGPVLLGPGDAVLVEELIFLHKDVEVEVLKGER